MPVDADRCARRAGVPGDVAERFLGDPVDDELLLAGQRAEIAGQAPIDNRASSIRDLA